MDERRTGKKQTKTRRNKKKQETNENKKTQEKMRRKETFGQHNVSETSKTHLGSVGLLLGGLDLGDGRADPAHVDVTRDLVAYEAVQAV